MRTSTRAERHPLFSRSGIVLSILTIAGFPLVMTTQGPASSSNHAGGFALPAQAAESRFGASLLATSTTTLPRVAQWDRPDSERILEPRECDVLNGISTACIFMD